MSKVAPPEEEQPQVGVSALDVLRVAFVTKAEQAEDESNFHKPLFCHQIYENEMVVERGNPKVDLVFHATDMQMAVIVRPDPNAPDPAPVTGTDLMGSLATHIVERHFTSVDEMLSASDAAFAPLGSKIAEYTSDAHLRADMMDDGAAAPAQEGTTVHEVYKSNFEDAAFRKLHRRFQLLNLLYIDAASYIEEEDPRWDVFTLFRKTEINGELQYTFIGFTTIYKFYAYPESTRHRVSQFIILPPYQKQGHALKLLSAVREQCLADDDCVEVVMEDPTHQFYCIRILAELLDFNRLEVWGPDALEKDLTLDEVRELGKKLSVNKKSVRRAHEIFRQRALGMAPTDDETKTLRLAIKARLFRQHEDELEGLEEDARKEKLHEMYTATLEENGKLIDRLNNLLA